jgi:hypothetical protein
MKKLALAAVSTFALTNLALADGKPTWNPDVIKGILKNEKLVKKYGTVGYPLADTLDPGFVCEKDINLYDMSWPLYSQTVLGVAFNVGFGGEVRLVNDTTKVGAELVLGPQIELFGSTHRPLDVTFTASTRADGLNYVEATVNGFGQMLTTVPITSSMSPISRVDTLGYSLPNPNNYVGEIGDSHTCGALPCDHWSWKLHSELVAHIGAFLSFKVAPTGVAAHALASAAAWAEAGVNVGAYDSNDKQLVGTAINGRIDAIRLLYGGRAMMLPQSGGGWVADAASSLAITDAMGADLNVSLPIIGQQSLFKLNAKEYFKDNEFSCGFKKKMIKKG